MIYLFLLPVMGLASWLLSRWLHERRQPRLASWRSMQTESIPFRYYSTFPVDETLLVSRVNRAYWALMNFGPWRGARLWAALANVNIWVAEPPRLPPTVCTPRETQSTLSGPLSRSDIRVGRSLDTLCHELAHMAESKVDQRVDREHKTWGARGIARAVEAYAEAQIL